MWPFKKKRIYLDYASAPPVLPEAERAMRDATKIIGNPGAIHADGVAAMRALEGARERIAAELEVKPREIIFTSGLTESNNIAIVGFARAFKFLRSDLKNPQGRTLENSHWIVSSIEHSSVLDCFGEIERVGGTVTHIDPDEHGVIHAERLEHALRPETVFVSIGWANNELGTIQPLAKITQVLRTHEKAHKTRVTLHTDAGQAPLYLPTTAHTLGPDLISIGGNKLYGPHGVGALYIGSRLVSVDIARILHGGPQERGLRPGTESVALALGFAAAYEHVATMREREAKRLRQLRDAFARDLQHAIPEMMINGDLRHVLPHMLNLSIPHISSEYVVLALDSAGISMSTKSACREGEESRSHVVHALGGPKWRAENTLRFSLGAETTAQHIARTVAALATIVHRSAKG
ncbi:MAG TPA: cysteine desulfurase family protein [Candidatus Paceibacterota bacterium]